LDVKVLLERKISAFFFSAVAIFFIYDIPQQSKKEMSSSGSNQNIVKETFFLLCYVHAGNDFESELQTDSR
jgi:hypothetical protein